MSPGRAICTNEAAPKGLHVIVPGPAGLLCGFSVPGPRSSAVGPLSPQLLSSVQPGTLSGFEQGSPLQEGSWGSPRQNTPRSTSQRSCPGKLGGGPQAAQPPQRGAAIRVGSGVCWRRRGYTRPTGCGVPNGGLWAPTALLGKPPLQRDGPGPCGPQMRAS